MYLKRAKRYLCLFKSYNLVYNHTFYDPYPEPDIGRMLVLTTFHVTVILINECFIFRIFYIILWNYVGLDLIAALILADFFFYVSV
jgi:hypothetical protein